MISDLNNGSQDLLVFTAQGFHRKKLMSHQSRKSQFYFLNFASFMYLINCEFNIFSTFNISTEKCTIKQPKSIQ